MQIAILLAVFVISAFGMTHLNLSDADKAALAAKPAIYRGFINLCRRLWLVMIVGVVLWIVVSGLGNSGGGDCDYSRNGASCTPY